MAEVETQKELDFERKHKEIYSVSETSGSWMMTL